MNEKKCREIVLERSQGLCERCGQRRYLTIHHRKKRSHGGPFSPINCVAVCGSGTTLCHGDIESHPNEAESAGFHTRPWQEMDKPLLLHGKTWVHLDESQPRYHILDEGVK